MIKLNERVRVVKPAPGDLVVQVLCGDDASNPKHWNAIRGGWSKSWLDNQANTIITGIRLACEDVRERCAEVARARVDLHAEAARTTGYCRERDGWSGEAELIAAAIRELEL